MIDASSLIPGETRIRDDDGFCGTVVYVGRLCALWMQWLWLGSCHRHCRLVYSYSIVCLTSIHFRPRR